jgi:hypothetical protein
MPADPLDNRTLEDIDGQKWGAPEADTSLAQDVHRLRRVPLRLFQPADLRVMIAQRVGLPYLVPRALGCLAADPFLESDYYPGDLLVFVAELDDAFWQANPQLRRTAVTVLDSALDRIDELDVNDRQVVWPRIVAARARFA